MTLSLVFTIIIPVLLIIPVTLVIGRTKGTRTGEFDSDSLSFVGGVFNAVFVVILAFYVVFAWQTGDDIDSNSAAEADALINIYWQGDVVAPPAGAQIHALVRGYANEVVDHEWDGLARNETDAPASRILGRLRGVLTALPDEPETVKTAREQGLQDLQQVNDHHLQRIDDTTSDSADNDPFTNTLLIATIAGSVLMLVFPLLIGVTARGRHIAVMGLLTLVLGTMVFFAFELANPLQGMFAHSPGAFQSALQQFSTDP